MYQKLCSIYLRGAIPLSIPALFILNSFRWHPWDPLRGCFTDGDGSMVDLTGEALNLKP